MQKIKKFLIYRYFALRTWWPFWFHILNKSARTYWKKHQGPLTPLQEKIVSDLKENGIAVTHVNELFPNVDIFNEMLTHTNEHEQHAHPQTKKKFLLHYWSAKPNFSLKNPFVRFSLSNTVTSIVNSYMEMTCKISYMALMKTLVTESGTEEYSQAWHRDPEERKILKVFIYINDVDETAGPFIYIPKSHYSGKWGKIFPQKSPEGSYPSSEFVSKIIPEENVKKMTGKAGTVIFCDTYGLHKGGFATEKERIMYTTFFAAPSSTDPRRFTFDKKDFEKLDDIAKFAITE